MNRNRSGISLITGILVIRLVLVVVQGLTTHPDVPQFDRSILDQLPTPTFQLPALQPHTVPMIGPDGQTTITLP